jgi:hypothetical protein
MNPASPEQSRSIQACECENPERGLFIWRGDKEWWSCVQCDGRVRPLTEAEKHVESAKRQHGARTKRPGNTLRERSDEPES